MINSFIKRLSWHILPILAAMLTLLALREIDTKVFKVVDDFTVMSVQRVDESIVISGTMDVKRNDCDIKDLVVYQDQSIRLPIILLDRVSGDSKIASKRIAGVQVWGPWVVKDAATANTLSLYTVHRCHFMWTHTTKLATIYLPKDFLEHRSKEWHH